MKFFIVIVCFLFGFAAAQEITSSECNVSKGCFRSPSNCTSSSNCDFMVTYQLDKSASTVAFEVSAKHSQATKWIAVGLSTVQTMVGARGEMCIDGASSAQLKGFLTDKYGAPTMFEVSGNPSVIFQGLKTINGALVCRYTRSVSSSASYQVGLNKKFYFVVASGSSVSANGEANYHGPSKTSSPIKYNVAFPIVQGNTTTVAPATTNQVISNTTMAATTMSSNTTTSMPVNTTTNGMPVNSTTVVPSAEPSMTPSNSSSVAPSAEPETTPSGSQSTVKPDDTKGSGMTIAPTAFVTIACLVIARMSS